MTPEKYEQLKRNINDLLPAHQWLIQKMLASPKDQTSLDIIFKTPEAIYISKNSNIGPHTVLDGAVRIRGASDIGHHCIIDNAHLTDAQLGNYVFIGPYAQINRAKIGSGTDIPHHCYIGDVSMGEGNNVGDAVTFSNFDGIEKHTTVIEDDCFFGTQQKIVPPIRIGRESYVVALYLYKYKGRDIPPHSFVVQGVDAEGRLYPVIKENRSFKIAPGKWLFTKKPITPELMYAFREKLYAVITEENRWKFYTTPLAHLKNTSPLDIIKSDGDEGMARLINFFDDGLSGSFS